MKSYTSAKEFRNLLTIDRLSNCCGAVVYPDSDICSDCKEHCGIEVTCELCEGTGFVEELAQYQHPLRIDPKYVKVICPECQGEGTVEVDE